jgi:D-alanyl-D-alanine carboxypeptidase
LLNPQGFDDKGQYSTALDLVKIVLWIKKNYPLITEITAKKGKILNANKYHRSYSLPNLYKLVGTHGITGMKVGLTAAAKHTVVSSVQKEGKEYVLVLLGCSTIEARAETITTPIKAANINTKTKPLLPRVATASRTANR